MDQVVIVSWLQVLRRSGTRQERAWAKRIEPVSQPSNSFLRYEAAAWSAAAWSSMVLCKDCREARKSMHHSPFCVAERVPAQVLKHPHFLLVTLVLCNAAATEVRLPIALSSLGVIANNAGRGAHLRMQCFDKGRCPVP